MCGLVDGVRPMKAHRDLLRPAVFAPRSATFPPRTETEFPQQMSAIVRLRTHDDAVEKFVRVAKGEPENFVTADDCKRWLMERQRK